MIRTKRYDFLIAGSGFGGSITAMCLARAGFDVCLVEKGSHPRFAIGESSTPVADMILRDLAGRFNLPFLKELSRYGEWQKHHPGVTCGLKRGFSYYTHQKGNAFQSDRDHSAELLVAASLNDFNSDTHWLRSDVDHFLVQKCQETGVDYFDNTGIQQMLRKNGVWEAAAERESEKLDLKAEWVIDATGSSTFSETFFGTSSSSSGFKTNSCAIYSHFDGVQEWEKFLTKNRFYTADYPFNPDHSALHHLIEEGWIWMLRFNDNRLSAGVMIDRNTHPHDPRADVQSTWQEIIKSYPSIHSLFSTSNTAARPGQIIQTPRLQRRINRIYGEGWAALNHTAGFVDPLHSTGIAHTLSGVEKLVALFIERKESDEMYRGLKELQDNYYKELEFIDLLVSSCYKTRHHFKLFTAAVMLYFTASIRYEQDRLNGIIPDTFLCAGVTDIRRLAERSYSDIEQLFASDPSESAIRSFVDRVKARIEPYNGAGLMDDGNNNMHSHTSVLL